MIAPHCNEVDRLFIFVVIMSSGAVIHKATQFCLNEDETEKGRKDEMIVILFGSRGH